jgi:hypothetical protein
MNAAPTAEELRAREIEYRAKAKFTTNFRLAAKYLDKAEWYARAAAEATRPPTVSAEPERQRRAVG